MNHRYKELLKCLEEKCENAMFKYFILIIAVFFCDKIASIDFKKCISSLTIGLKGEVRRNYLHRF